MVDMEIVTRLIAQRGVDPVGWKIDDMAEKVMNYINLDGIPDGLLRIFVKLCADYSSSGDYQRKENRDVIQTMTEGDTTIQFDVTAKSIYKTADELICQYSTDLNRYRSVYAKKLEYPWMFQGGV